MSACASLDSGPDLGRIRPEALERTVRFLASPEFRGRAAGSPECRRAAEWIAARFQAAGLKPGAGSRYFHEFDFLSRGGRRLRGTNVAGTLPGTDLAAEIVILAAHHDHLGEDRGVVYRGADDNASGVAVVLAIAELLGGRPQRRTVLFVSFDAEEVALAGSTRFVQDGVVDPRRVAAMICLDLVGGSFFETERRVLYALGSEYSVELERAVREEPAEVMVVPLGIYLVEPLGPFVARSDYRAFRQKRVPFVFFSTGTPWYYHTPEDTPERLDYAKLCANARYIARVLMRLATEDRRPEFRDDPPASVEDARSMLTRVEAILDGRAGLLLEPSVRPKLEEFRDKVRRIVDAGSISPRDRTTLQLGMALVFQIVARSRGR